MIAENDRDALSIVENQIGATPVSKNQLPATTLSALVQNWIFFASSKLNRFQREMAENRGAC
jgi:hypothetical protein